MYKFNSSASLYPQMSPYISCQSWRLSASGHTYIKKPIVRYGVEEKLNINFIRFIFLQLLTDEQNALQLAFTSLEEKFRKVQEDNNDLVTRWMQIKVI